MAKTFRDYHLQKILNSFSVTSIPLDVHLGAYFRQNKAIGSKDRKYIAEKIYTLIRWLALIDHYCGQNRSWEERCRALETLNIASLCLDSSLPPHIRASFPKPYFELMESHYGQEKTLELCHISNSPAPTTIRANLLKTNRQELLGLWNEKFNVSPTTHSLWGINFAERLNFQTLDEFKNGLFEVQDEASQLIADLVDAKPGDLVLDYCAGAGGKTLAFAHKLQGKGQIYLHDIRERSLIEAKRRLKRAGIENGQVLSADAPHKTHLKGKMDWVLVDVPCSGSGTLRRNPDMKWKFSSGMIDRLVEEQRTIFKEALSYLAPKGKIVYATCSILPQENEHQVTYFQDACGLELRAKPFSSLPSPGGMDGFFGAVLHSF